MLTEQQKTCLEEITGRLRRVALAAAEASSRGKLDSRSGDPETIRSGLVAHRLAESALCCAVAGYREIGLSPDHQIGVPQLERLEVFEEKVSLTVGSSGLDVERAISVLLTLAERFAGLAERSMDDLAECLASGSVPAQDAASTIAAGAARRRPCLLFRCS